MPKRFSYSGATHGTQLPVQLVLHSFDMVWYSRECYSWQWSNSLTGFVKRDHILPFPKLGIALQKYALEYVHFKMQD